MKKATDSRHFVNFDANPRLFRDRAGGGGRETAPFAFDFPVRSAYVKKLHWG